MAKDKKSVLLYCDIIHTIEKMDNETAGIFFKHYLRYINDLNPITDNLIVDITFESIKQNLKRDLKKWEDKTDERSDSGKLGNLKRWHIDIYNRVISSEITLEEGVNESLIIANNHSAISDIANVAVTVTVTDTVKDNVNDIKRNTNTPPPSSEEVEDFEVKESELTPTKKQKLPARVEEEKSCAKKEEIHQDIKTCYLECLRHFPEHLRPKDKKQQETWIDTIEKLVRIDGIPIDYISGLVGRIRADSFWESNFLALPKLRKTNKDGIKYIIVFNEKFKTNDKEAQFRQLTAAIREQYPEM